MSKADIVRRVQVIISIYLGMEVGVNYMCDVDYKLKEDLGIDSLDSIEIVMELEDEFGISIPDEEAEKVVKVSDICEVIERLTSDDR